MKADRSFVLFNFDSPGTLLALCSEAAIWTDGPGDLMLLEK